MGSCEALPGGDAAERCLVEMLRSAAWWRCCKRCLVEMLRSAAQWRCCEPLPGGDAASTAQWRCCEALHALLDEGRVLPLFTAEALNPFVEGLSVEKFKISAQDSRWYACLF